MTTRHTKKLVHVADYAAEIDVELTDAENGWPPYLSLEEAERVDAVRIALQAGDVLTASQWARVFTLTPVRV